MKNNLVFSHFFYIFAIVIVKQISTMVRTKEQLEAYFAKRRKAEAYKRWVEERKRIKAREAVKKALEKKQQTSTTITIEHKAAVIIADVNYYQHLTDDELYTKEELMHIEQLYPNETGRINWNFYNYLVNKTKQLCQSTQNKQRKKNTGNSITKQ